MILAEKTWIYFLQEKFEALIAFKSYKAMVEKEVGCSIQLLCTDVNKIHMNLHIFVNNIASENS